MKGQRHPKIVIKFTEKEVQAIQEALDTPELWEKKAVLLCVELMQKCLRH